MAEPTGRYDAAYYHLMASHGAGSAAAIAPLLVQRYDPKSVIDVGCSEGYFLDALKAAGVDDLHGVDGPSNDGRTVTANGHPFTVVDLQGAQLNLGRHFDLALCLETAEHLAAQYADSLVAGLAALADVVVFSAAVPHQFGEGHVNLQPQSYWAAKFARHGLLPDTTLRESLWSDERVSWWYRQNVVVYTKRPREARPLDVIHPEMVRALLVPGPAPTGRESLTSLVAAVRRRVNSR